MRRFDWACPRCRTRAEELADIPLPNTVWRCPSCTTEYRAEDGIWSFLLPGRHEIHSPFLDRYRSIRRAEGRARTDGAFYRALPFVELPGEIGQEWRVRAKTFRALAEHLARRRTALRAVDLGAGSGWMSHRLAQLGHDLLAIDLLTDEEDGLGAARHYPIPFARARAEFDYLPLSDQSVDAVLFNGSFHYSAKFEQTLRESLRVLAPGGQIYILDTPVFAKKAPGEQMMAERSARGNEGNLSRSVSEAESLRSRNNSESAVGGESSIVGAVRFESPEGFLHSDRFEELAAELRIHWERIDVKHGWRWELEPLRCRLRGLREPARFPLLIAEPIN